MILKLIFQYKYRKMENANVSKDILRLLISQYFSKEDVYTCQWVCKWFKSCISVDNLYLAQCAYVAKKMQETQSKYLEKRRKKDIEWLVYQEIRKLKDGANHLYLKKKLTTKYTNQEGDTRCWKCYGKGTPEVITAHIPDCKGLHSKNCSTCGALNPDEYLSPHDAGCPLPLTYCKHINGKAESLFCFEKCEIEGPYQMIKHHHKTCQRACNTCHQKVLYSDMTDHLNECFQKHFHQPD